MILFRRDCLPSSDFSSKRENRVELNPVEVQEEVQEERGLCWKYFARVQEVQR